MKVLYSILVVAGMLFSQQINASNSSMDPRKKLIHIVAEGIAELLSGFTESSSKGLALYRRASQLSEDAFMSDFSVGSLAKRTASLLQDTFKFLLRNENGNALMDDFMKSVNLFKTKFKFELIT